MKDQKKEGLFNIEIKITGKKLNVPVFKDDTHDTLIRRLNSICPIQHKSKEAVKDKII